ncbi:hypothetical protein B0H15DRAFT_155121 [Mycena belliarum]|uniref:Transmembrane protein n=1 Tax=Mycena belliarum TaxID=1033014 RepID=A0AAD6UCL7_9AGAR|nr:hypothetical protein B0H15DRAFT_155121 [Mycena belliae]
MFPGPPDELASLEVLKPLLLVSSWINVFLYTLELVLARRYFQCPKRPPLYKAGVISLLFFDTVCTLTVCVNISFFLLGPPPGETFEVSMSPTSVVVFMTYCSAAVEQAVLAHLYFSLTGNIIITACMGLAILVHMGFAFACAALIIVFNSELSGALMTTSVSAIACSVTDIFIAICLGFKVWQMLSPGEVHTPTHSFARKFLLLILSAGFIVVVNTLAMMSLLLSHSYVSEFFLSYQGRVYTLALLANFLVGVHFRREEDISVGEPSHSHVPFTGVLFRDIERSDLMLKTAPSNTDASSDGADSGTPSASSTPAMQEYGQEYKIRPELMDPRPSMRVRSQP